MTYLKERRGGSAASTAAASSGYGRSLGGGQGLVNTGFLPSSVKLKVWGDWANVRGTAIDKNEASDLVTKF